MMTTLSNWRRQAAVLAGCAAVALLAFYGLHGWLDATRPLVVLEPKLPDEDASSSPTGLANPASVYCIKNGGTVDIMAGWDSGQIGICTFPNGNQCEEWAMMRGDCPVGGVAILRTWDAAEAHCAIRGGEVWRMNSGLEPSICAFKTTNCLAQDYMETGTCVREKRGN
jgi:putative hemolysin